MPNDQLASELSGDLPCFGCGYNLRGLSVLASCPECGSPVRATILVRVDPLARNLRPIRHPRLMYAGLVLLVGGAVLASLSSWWHLSLVHRDRDPRALALIGLVGGVLLSALGAGCIAALSPRPAIREWLGCLVLAPVLALLWDWHASGARTMAVGASPWATFVILVLVAGSMLLLRRQVRALAARSLLMRRGEVDRQNLLVMATVAIMGTLGCVVRLIGDSISGQTGDTLAFAGSVVVVLTSVLLTLGFMGTLIDVVRLRSAILASPLALEDLLGERPGP